MKVNILKKPCVKCGATDRNPKGDCRVCKKAIASTYYANNREKIKKATSRWEKDNPQKKKAYAAKYRAANSKKEKVRSTRWNLAHPERRKAAIVKWKKANPEKPKAFAKKYRSTQKGKLSHNMTCRINNSLRRGVKNSRHWESLVNFTVDQLNAHIEKLFKNGMSWERFMKGDIQIDHKIPIAAFNYEKPEDIDFKKCWSLKNLQPLWKRENIIKKDKLTKPFQPSLLISEGGRIKCDHLDCIENRK